MAVAGEIAEVAREKMPVTWNALANDKDQEGNPRYGESSLRRVVDRVKYRIFGEVVDPDDELATYGLTACEYAGLLAAIALCAPGADYWASQRIQDQSGQRVAAAFVDRAEKLWELQARLIRDAEKLRPEVSSVLKVKRVRPPLKVSDVLNENFITPDPFGVGRGYALPEANPITAG